MSFKTQFKALLGSTALVAASTLPGFATDLHILHFNDFHSRIESVSRYNSTCSAESEAAGECFGGAARLYALVNQMRSAIEAEGDPVIVLDAGDASQGSLFYTTYGGEVEAELLERIGIDAMAVGNHEFDLGPEGLAVFLDNVSFPILSSNLDVSGADMLAGRVAPYTIIEEGDMRIGIVSALATDTVETSSPGPTVTFNDEIEALNAAVAELQAEGASPIIALTHVGYRKDQEIAAQVPGLAAVVGGHSHTYLSASDPDRDGPYPTWVDAENGALVPVVTAGAYSRYLGHLVLELDDEGNLLHASGDAIPITAEVEPDADIAEWVAGLAGPIDEFRNEPVSESAGLIEGDRSVCRQRECSMGTLVADAMLARVADQGVTIAIQNGGGLRASIDEGVVTMGEVYSVLPFQNTLATFELSGANIVAALENGVSQLEDGAGRFAQVAGLQYTFDPAAEAGSRVSDVMVQSDGAWVPIDPEATYGVVTNDYMRNGGDGYAVFRDEASNAYDFGPDLADVLVAYMQENAPYEPYTDGRITRLGE
ncbi:multifunctional 2',3'-cyclic-nucleotide 2'-phosphodiesterase/5'-nucleotidase/3'-nucleotidase [Pararhodobacter marinus]|uniref:Multifunctional 2',3'-cyclic-nucleotide 2'-phosphodiesterase/5'-nucleotidase/3'-nucleotidase n=1 Tax=Pararhodobacter marinus TaxID=2184063 RepID=A0A2U2C5L2_9RHOB|nr:bifunctional metallophosphatase/5'-nucleotidase [Pararhodobacter marinus]PWE27084.1 multifunctional 2',3'-cyclic-nucleotide 2'-phosphodiesterase/5'-nucleotidase/3'-nucleotidase [Pararhodobacter marinus]